MIADNLKELLFRIQCAAERSARNLEDITLIGVTKYVSIEEAQELARLGVEDFGENRLPQAQEKAEALPGKNVHFIGHVQTNKVNKVVGHFCCLHSVDRDALADAVIKRATTLGIRQQVFVQVNVSGEVSKGGYRPDEVAGMLSRYRDSSHMDIVGLMTMAPNGVEEEKLRKIFRQLADLAREHELKGLSMGMSNDFEIAIEEGATHVRVGSLLFKGN